MFKTRNVLQALLLAGSLSLVLLVGGCASEPSLTKEELELKRLYGREVAEDQEYIVQSAGFAVRPVLEPFVNTFMRRLGDDGILFFPDGHMDRDPRFYAGRLSTYMLGINMFGSQQYALSNLKALVEHGHKPHPIRLVADTSFPLGEYNVRQFRWEIVDGGTSPVNQIQIDQGATRDAEMIGAIVTTGTATYLVSLTENHMSTFRYKSLKCDADRVSVGEASAMMADRFRKFLSGVRFNIE